MDKVDIEKLISEGKSQRQIAETLGVSQTNIRYWLKKYKLKTSKNKYNKKENQICRCGESNLKNFYPYKVGWCKACHNKYVVKRMKENRIRAVDYLGGKCKECGYNRCNCALDIHHLDPSKKDENFVRMRGWGWNKIKKELDGCILLCKNCHALVHHGDIEIT